MKKWIGSLLIWTVLAVPALAADEAESRRKESENYENPILSLLLLPVNVLLKIASIFGPSDADKARSEPPPKDGPPN